MLVCVAGLQTHHAGARARRMDARAAPPCKGADGRELSGAPATEPTSPCLCRLVLSAVLVRPLLICETAETSSSLQTDNGAAPAATAAAGVRRRGAGAPLWAPCPLGPTARPTRVANVRARDIKRSVQGLSSLLSHSASLMLSLAPTPFTPATRLAPRHSIRRQAIRGLIVRAEVRSARRRQAGAAAARAGGRTCAHLGSQSRGSFPSSAACHASQPSHCARRRAPRTRRAWSAKSRRVPSTPRRLWLTRSGECNRADRKFGLAVVG